VDSDSYSFVVILAILKLEHCSFGNMCGYAQKHDSCLKILGQGHE